MEEIESKKIVRRLDDIQKSVDAFSSDHNLLEDNLVRTAGLEQAIHLNRENQDKIQMELKAEIREVRDQIKEIKEMIEKQTFMVTSKNKNLLEKLKKIFKREVKQK